ncbi:MAG: thermosome subunit, partial [Thermoplasmata archaeon]|nr:thermosome subunit [Thermoplasmata archaeon]
GEIDDMLKNNVIEPLRVSMQEIQASSEAATMILRIDDVIASKEMEEKSKGSKGEPEGSEEF